MLPDDHKNNRLIQLNLDCISKYLYKFTVVNHFLAQKKDMEALIVNYMIQNYCSKENQMISEINLYLSIDNKEKDYSPNIHQALKQLIEQKIID